MIFFMKINFKFWMFGCIKIELNIVNKFYNEQLNKVKYYGLYLKRFN